MGPNLPEGLGRRVECEPQLVRRRAGIRERGIIRGLQEPQPFDQLGQPGGVALDRFGPTGNIAIPECRLEPLQRRRGRGDEWQLDDRRTPILGTGVGLGLVADGAELAERERKDDRINCGRGEPDRVDAAGVHDLRRLGDQAASEVRPQRHRAGPPGEADLDVDDWRGEFDAHRRQARLLDPERAVGRADQARRLMEVKRQVAKCRAGTSCWSRPRAPKSAQGTFQSLLAWR